MTQPSLAKQSARIPDDAPDIIVAQDVHKHYGSFQALKGVNLRVRAGEVVVIIGPSGSGKSTFIRTINRLEPHDQGSIFVDGVELKDGQNLDQIRREVGMVFQSFNLFPHLSVLNNLTLAPTRVRKVTRAQAEARAMELLRRVGIEEQADKFPAQLSGGQQQRIALARALATKPGLLLLDEPLSALDAIVRVKLRGEIRSLQRKLGVTTIMVTHDQEEAFAVADRIVVMNQGGIEQVGSAMQVYRDPATLFVADFVGRINALPATPEDGGLRVGGQVFRCEHESLNGHPAGRELRVYLRPEDVLARPIPPGDPNVFEARIDKIEFMGPYCLVRVHSAVLGAQTLTVYLSLNYLAEAQLEVGSRLPLRLLPDRMRVFS